MSDKQLPHSADPKTCGRTPWFLLLTSLILLGLALSLAGSPVQAQAPANLLSNPSFEGDYFAWSGIPEIQVAHDWTPWWVVQSSSDPPEINRRPEYKQANIALYANRVHSGSAAQQWFTFHSTHIAGMYQQAYNVQPGTRLQFSIWAQVWSSSDDNPYESVNPGVINLQVGIDPTGNWDPWAATVVWSGQYNFYDAWGQLVVEAVAQSDTVTVFMKSAPKYPVKHNDTYWDDAALIVMGAAPPPPPPSLTPEIIPTESAATATSSPTAATATVAPPTPSPAPTATCAPPPADWVPYLVQSGDYLTALSVAFDVSLDEIIAANCLDRTNLYAGETLLLPPRPPTPTPPPPTATATATQPPAAEPSPSETATPLPSPTLVQVAAATLTSSPVPTASPAATTTPIAAEDPAEPAPTATPASGGGLGGLCGGSLAPNLLLVGIALLAQRKRAL